MKYISGYVDPSLVMKEDVLYSKKYKQNFNYLPTINPFFVELRWKNNTCQIRSTELLKFYETSNLFKCTNHDHNIQNGNEINYIPLLEAVEMLRVRNEGERADWLQNFMKNTYPDYTSRQIFKQMRKATGTF